MRVLIVARCREGKYSPFIMEQVNVLKNYGVECVYFGVKSNGLMGYISHLPGLTRAIKSFNPDLIHAHYGLCGLLSNFQRKIPVMTTYHGSDINNAIVLKLSRQAIRFSAYNIFVSKKSVMIAQPRKNNYSIIPCGINLGDYQIVDKQRAREIMGLKTWKRYILFSGSFDNRVKNAPLAKDAISRIQDVELLELKGYTRTQVASLMQAVDVFLMTSHTEGSPQVIKEAMACGCPIVSVDVGDVKEMTEGVEGCFISKRDPDSIAQNLNKALAFNKRTKGRDVIMEKGLTNDLIALKLISIYDSLIKK